MATYMGTIGQGKIMTARFAGTCGTCKAPIAQGETIRYNGQAHHPTPEGCMAAQRAEALRRAATPAAPQAPTYDLTPIRAFVQGARDRGLKAPKLRVLDADGRTELTLGLTVTGHAPGSVSVKRAGAYVGTVRPDGRATMGVTPALAEHLLAVAADPAAAAKRYAVLMCRCSFCDLTLTDEGSVEVGYGPVCAKHWGLPHAPKGTPALAEMVARDRETISGFLHAARANGFGEIIETKAVMVEAEAEERAMQAMEAEGDRAQTAHETRHTMLAVGAALEAAYPLGYRSDEEVA